MVRWYHAGLDIEDRLGQNHVGPNPIIVLRCSCGRLFKSIRALTNPHLIQIDLPLNGYRISIPFRDIAKLRRIVD